MDTQLEKNIIDNKYEDNYKKSSFSRKVKVEGSSRVNKYKIAEKGNIIKAPENLFKKNIKMSSSSNIKTIEDAKGDWRHF